MQSNTTNKNLNDTNFLPNEKLTGNKISMTCIICPMGCQLEVTKDSESGIICVTGNSCKRGDAYAKKELTNPTRTLTCTVQVTNGKAVLVPAKSQGEVPRDMQLSCMEVIKRISVSAPIHAGDILYEDILNTGANIIACDDVMAR